MLFYSLCEEAPSPVFSGWLSPWYTQGAHWLRRSFLPPDPIGLCLYHCIARGLSNSLQCNEAATSLQR